MAKPRKRDAGALDAIGVLKADHRKVRALLSELEGTTPRAAAKRAKLLESIEQELKIHTRIEETIFYPAYRDAARKQAERRLYFEALEEHHVVDMVLPELKQTEPDSDEFSAKVKVLKELVEHHADEEESDMFPKARRLMNRDELMDLGEQLALAKEVAAAA